MTYLMDNVEGKGDFTQMWFKIQTWGRKVLGWHSKDTGIEEGEQMAQCQTLCMLRERIKLAYVKLLVTSNGRGKCTWGNWVCLEKQQDSNALEYLEDRELVFSQVLPPNPYWQHRFDCSTTQSVFVWPLCIITKFDQDFWTIAVEEGRLGDVVCFQMIKKVMESNEVNWLLIYWGEKKPHSDRLNCKEVELRFQKLRNWNKHLYCWTFIRPDWTNACLCQCFTFWSLALFGKSQVPSGCCFTVALKSVKDLQMSVKGKQYSYFLIQNIVLVLKVFLCLCAFYFFPFKKSILAKCNRR